MLTQCATINGNRAGNGQCHPDPFSGSGAKNAISSQVKTSNDYVRLFGSGELCKPCGYEDIDGKSSCKKAMKKLNDDGKRGLSWETVSRTHRMRSAVACN